jgi:signal transduction histidine kinase
LRKPNFLTAPFARRTWAESLYGFVSLPLEVICFTLVVTGIAVGIGLTPLAFGLPVLAGGVLVCRWCGALERGLLVGLLKEDIARPRRVLRRAEGEGLWPVLRRRIGDSAGWRSAAFSLVQLPLAILSFTMVLTFWITSIAMIAYPYYRHFLPVMYDTQGNPHRGAVINSTDVGNDHWTGHWADTTAWIWGLCGGGVVLFFFTPWIIHGFVSLQRALGRALLGPVSMSQRVRDLEESRASAAAATNDRLRSIERDLHDGTQARLVALAMQLGQAKEDLEDATPESAERVRQLIDSAHQQSKDTLVELREIARGVHPAILDSGMEAALTSLAANAPFPVSVEVELPDRPSPATETAAYFMIAELLTNAIKHSNARAAAVSVNGTKGKLTLCVADDGRGGALKGGGSGLAGVADRLARMDGELDIDSPVGGPTVITASMPMKP